MFIRKIIQCIFGKCYLEKRYVSDRAPRDESPEIPHFPVRPRTTVSLRSSVYFIFGNVSIICQCSFPTLIEKAAPCELAGKESHGTFLDGMYYISSAKGPSNSCASMGCRKVVGNTSCI